MLFLIGMFPLPVILLMEEILHHLGCMKPCKSLDICRINWLAGFLPSTVAVTRIIFFLLENPLFTFTTGRGSPASPKYEFFYYQITRTLKYEQKQFAAAWLSHPKNESKYPPWN